MPPPRTQDRAPIQSRPSVSTGVERRPAAPEAQPGPQSPVRAAETLLAEGPGAAGRARRMNGLQRSVGNGRAGRMLQRVPSAAAEGAAWAGEQNPHWAFQPSVEGSGFRMNPVFWRVTYSLRFGKWILPFTNQGRQTALESIRQYVVRHPPPGDIIEIDRIEVALRPGASPSAAARDLIAPASRRHYSFECYTAAALVQLVGVWRGLQQTSPATADQTFDQRYADFRVTIPEAESENPRVHMGGGDLRFNLAQRDAFTLRQLLADPADRGLQRGDWVYLSNESFIASGPFRGENATYLGNKRFFGHGMGLFDIGQYAARLQRDQGVRLPRAQILDQVRVRPRYRASETREATGAAAP